MALEDNRTDMSAENMFRRISSGVAAVPIKLIGLLQLRSSGEIETQRLAAKQ